MKKELAVLAGAALIFTGEPAQAQNHDVDHLQHDRSEQSVSAVIAEPDVVVRVEGLACKMCARSLTKALKNVEAVDQVQVFLGDDQRALVTLVEGQRTTREGLVQAVREAGFKTRAVEFVDATPGDES